MDYGLTPKQLEIKDAMDRHDDDYVNRLNPSPKDIDAVAKATIAEKGANVKPLPEVSGGRSAALGFSQGASLGAADEVASAVVPHMVGPGVQMTPTAMEYLKKVDPASHAQINWLNSMRPSSDSVQAAQDKELNMARDQHPLPYGAGYVAGAAPLAAAAGPSAPAQAAIGGVGGFMGANGGLEDRIGGGVVGAGSGYIGGLAGGVAAPQASTYENIANSTARGLMDIPPEEAIRMGVSGQLPKVIGAVKDEMSGGGGRLGIAERLAARNQPVAESIEDLLSAEAATGASVDSSYLANLVGNKAKQLENSGTFSERSEAAPGMRYYEDIMRRQSTDQPATGAPKSALDVWDERKSLDQAANFGGRPGMPNNPDLARANIRPVIDDQLHAMVQEPSKLAQLNSLEDQYHTIATAKKYMLDSSAKVGGQGSYLSDTASALSGMGEARGRGMFSALSKPTREALVINVGNVANWAAKKLRTVGQSNIDSAASAAGAASGRVIGDTKLAQILQSVATSPDPDMEDYLYREMYPEYGAAMIAAEDEMKKATPENADIQAMGNNMRKLQGM